jgi:L-threonylcarbamoyladenylate synthase
MAEVITKKEFLEKEEFYIGEIKKGKIFVYPTDTIYGIGCDASNAKSVKKIREIKKRDSKPFSLIVPGKEWIIDNCFVPEKFSGELEKLPGKYTLILKLKDDMEVAKKELVGDFDTIGVRIPGNWFAEFLGRNGLVFVTTSVNISGEEAIKKVGGLKEEISEKVDYVIDYGVLDGSASVLVDLSGEEVREIKR